jgi:hypothetical protein
MRDEKFHNKPFIYDSKQTMDQIIYENFSKQQTDMRKQFIQNGATEGTDYKQLSISYTEFFENEFRDYMYRSCERAIPCVVDGLKQCQRKILYTLLKKSHTQQIKVTNAASEVQTYTQYHHGE